MAAATAAIFYIVRPQPLRIGVGGWEGFAPLVYAVESGLASRAGIDVTLDPLSSSEREAGLRAGTLSCAVTTTGTWLQWVDSGLDATLLALTDVSRGADAIVARGGAGSPTSVAELRGRRVAAWRYGAPLTLLVHALDAAGVPIGAVTVVDLEPEAAERALAAGAVDAAVLYGAPLQRARAASAVLADTTGLPVVAGALGCRRGVLTVEQATALAALQTQAVRCLTAPRDRPLPHCPARQGTSARFGHDFAQLAGGIPEADWADAGRMPSRTDMHASLGRLRDLLAAAGALRAPGSIDLDRLLSGWHDAGDRR